MCSTLRPPMVPRSHALCCLMAALAVATPRVANAEPAPAESPQPEAATDEPAGEQPEGEAPSDTMAEGAASLAPTEEAPSTADEESSDEESSDEELSDEEIYDEGATIEGDVMDDNPGDGAESAQEPSTSTVPERLPRLQRIGWYHVIGAFTLGTTAGLLAGLAEREEDRATRIAAAYDFDAGSSPLYADTQQRYEDTLDRGQALETSAIVFGALAGATAIAAITLFAVDAKRKRPSATARRMRVGPGSLEVSF